MDADLLDQPAWMASTGLRVKLFARQCVDSGHMIAVLNCGLNNGSRCYLRLRIIPSRAMTFRHITPAQTVEVVRFQPFWRRFNVLAECLIDTFKLEEFIIAKEGTTQCVSFALGPDLDISCLGWQYTHWDGLDDKFSSKFNWSTTCCDLMSIVPYDSKQKFVSFEIRDQAASEHYLLLLEDLHDVENMKEVYRLLLRVTPHYLELMAAVNWNERSERFRDLVRAYLRCAEFEREKRFHSKIVPASETSDLQINSWTPSSNDLPSRLENSIPPETIVISIKNLFTPTEWEPCFPMVECWGRWPEELARNVHDVQPKSPNRHSRLLNGLRAMFQSISRNGGSHTKIYQSGKRRRERDL